MKSDDKHKNKKVKEKTEDVVWAGIIVLIPSVLSLFIGFTGEIVELILIGIFLTILATILISIGAGQHQKDEQNKRIKMHSKVDPNKSTFKKKNDGFDNFKDIKNKAKDFKPNVSLLEKEKNKLFPVYNLENIEGLIKRSDSGDGYATLSLILSYFQQTSAYILEPKYRDLVEWFQIAIKQGCYLSYHYYIHYLVNGHYQFNHPKKTLSEIETLLLEAESYNIWLVYDYLSSLYLQKSNFNKYEEYEIKKAKMGSPFDALKLSKYFKNQKKDESAYYWAHIALKLFEEDYELKQSYYDLGFPNMIDNRISELKELINTIESEY